MGRRFSGSSREQTVLREDLAGRKLKFIKGNRWLCGSVRDPRCLQPEGLAPSAQSLSDLVFRCRSTKFRYSRPPLSSFFHLRNYLFSMIYSIVILYCMVVKFVKISFFFLVFFFFCNSCCRCNIGAHILGVKKVEQETMARLYIFGSVKIRRKKVFANLTSRRKVKIKNHATVISTVASFAPCT